MAKSLKQKVVELVAPQKEKKVAPPKKAPEPVAPGFDPDLPESKQRWLR